jgi:hypothetical protein
LFEPKLHPFNKSIETYNISLEIPEQNLSNAINPTSIAGLVVKLQRIEKSALKFPNQPAKP